MPTTQRWARHNTNLRAMVGDELGGLLNDHSQQWEQPADHCRVAAGSAAGRSVGEHSDAEHVAA
jgi:hypothetical protein